MLPRLVALLVLCWGGAATAEEPLDQQVARAEFARGERAYVAGEYVAALSAFEAAYDSSRRPELLYNIGVCLENLGRFPQAVAHYERYLAESPPTPAHAGVKERVTALKASIAQAAQLDARPRTAPLVVAAAPARRPVYKRGWFWGVMGSVVVVVGVGLGVGLGLGLKRTDGFETNLPTGGPGAR